MSTVECSTTSNIELKDMPSPSLYSKKPTCSNKGNLSMHQPHNEDTLVDDNKKYTKLAILKKILSML